MISPTALLVIITAVTIVVTVVCIFLGFYFGKKRRTSKKTDETKYSTYAMVMVEPRPHPLMAAVLHNFHTHMDPKWDLYVFHGASHGEYARNAAASISASRHVYFSPLPTNDLNSTQYNAMMKQKSFWDKVHAENILVIQTDSSICGNNTQSIDDYTHLNYIGCSYSKNVHGMHHTPWGKNNCYGIGGLSFRKKSFMLACIEAGKADAASFQGEDVFFSNCAAKLGGMPESGQQIAEFCTQHAYDAKSWGVHKPSIRSNKLAGEFLQYCPEARPIWKGKPPVIHPSPS